MDTNEFFKTLEEKGFDTQKLDVANLRNYLSVVSEDRKREYSEVMRLMQHKEELGFLGYGDDVMLEFSIEPSDDGVTPGIHIDLLTVTDSSKEEYIRLNDVPYAHEDYTFCNVFECDSMEEFVGSVEELQTNIWPKYLKPTKSQEQEREEKILWTKEIADTNTPIILEEISLKDAGNWHIDGKEFGSVAFGEREIPSEGIYLGHVGYGNSLIQLHCVPNTEESKKGQLCISVEEYAPTMDALNPDSETKNFHLAVDNHLTLWTERVSEVPVNKTEFFCEPSKVSIDSFKEKAVAKMIEAKMISPSHYKEYKQLTEDNMDFASQVYEQDSKIEMYKSLSKIRPVETIRQNKLMPDDIEMLSVYYDQVADCLSDRNGLADATERIVEAMKGDGLDNARIGLVFKASEKLRNCLLEKGLASITQHQTQQNRADSSKTR